MIWGLTDDHSSLNKGIVHKTQVLHDCIRAETQPAVCVIYTFPLFKPRHPVLWDVPIGEGDSISHDYH